MATKTKCPGKVVNGKCIDKDGKEITAPYVSEKGAFYPDQKSLNSGCAKNPNGPGCKAIIDKMTPEQRAKIGGLQKLGGATKKYEVGGMTEAESCGKPGKPKCRKTFKSKGKSKETKGSLLATIGAGLLGGLGGYAAYKKYKEQQKGGATKYQKGGSTQDKKMSDLAKRGAGPVPKSTVDGTKWVKNTKAPNAKKYQNGGSAPHGPGSMTRGTVPPMMAKPDSEKTPKEKRQAKRELKKTLKYVSKKGSGYNTPNAKKYQAGGTPIPPSMTPPAAPQMTAPRPKSKITPGQQKPITGRLNGNEGYKPYANPPKPSMNAAEYRAKAIERYGSEELAREAKAIQKKGGTTYKTGGMVNPNAKLQAAKSAGSKGVKSGVNPKAAASKVARGRSGGTSVAPKKATPGRK